MSPRLRPRGQKPSAESRLIQEGGRFKVSLISHAYSEPGLRRQIVALSRHVDVELIAPSQASTLVWKAYRPAATPENPITTYRRIPLFGKQFALATATLGWRRDRPHLIHIDYDPWSVLFWQARLTAFALAPRARILVGAKKNTYRPYRGWRGRIKHLLTRAGLATVDHVMAASQMTAEMYIRELGLPADKVSVVTHVGVDVDVFSPAERSTDAAPGLLVGYVGRMTPHKGLEDLLKAVRRARAEGLDARLALLGAGEMVAELAAAARQETWISIRSPVPSDEVAEFLRELDIYVLPARILPDHQEHDGHALLQALACGVPTISTRSGIIPEMISPTTGLLVQAGSVDELTAALIDLGKDPAARRRFGEAGRSAVLDRYSLPVVAAAKAAVYRRALGRDGG